MRFPFGRFACIALTLAFRLNLAKHILELALSFRLNLARRVLLPELPPGAGGAPRLQVRLSGAATFRRLSRLGRLAMAPETSK